MQNIPVYGETEIEEVLSKVRARNKATGFYREHTVKEEDYYYVMLDNGSILLFIAEIKGRHNLPPERILDIAARFHPSKKML